MVALGNPVAGTIYARNAAHPAGTFVVTATFADHVASGRPAGIDIGNGKCGDPIIAMASGTVSLAGLIGSAKVVRIRHPQYPGYETGYAHLATIEVSLNQSVQAGQRIGTLGMTGATACHLHWGVKLNGVEIDGWPHLSQNGATDGGDMVPIPSGKFVQLANKVTKVTGTNGANFRAERLTTAPILKLYPLGTVFTPLMQADDGTSAGGLTPTRWFGGFGLDDRGFAIFGWLHSSVLAVPSDVPAPAPDCSQKVADAVAPLNTLLNAANQKITAAKNALA
jgi:murein DD-endopeptidase MepM/ murein hydrolase activator NlpD